MDLIQTNIGPHDFVPSEFPQGAGRCDVCGGLPGAKLHQPHVDPLARIAEALERIGDILEVAVSTREG